jgi:hypothetical protein
MTMMKTMIAMLGMGLLAMGCLGSEQPGPMGDESECSARWHLADVFTPPKPPAGEAAECLVVVAEGHTSLLYGAARDACDASLGEPTRVRVRWPNSVSVFHYEGHEAEWSVEACE